MTFASPNAVSVFRRLGLTHDLSGRDLAGTARELVPTALRTDEETLSAVLGGTRARDTEITDGETVVIVRSLPLLRAATSGGGPERRPSHTGACVLVRDVSDLRRRDRELVTKEATIREIHHRVKNNLQTVAALLRLQARRVSADGESRDALQVAERRVATIALVHEMLSHALDERVDFDEIADRLLTTVCDLVTPTEEDRGRVTTSRNGTFGPVPGDMATTLAMVLNELLQNAVEHAFTGLDAGHVHVGVARGRDELAVEVSDDGRGLPDGFDPSSGTSLGLSIVRALVEGELHGMLEVGAGERGGTKVRFSARSPSRPGAA